MAVHVEGRDPLIVEHEESDDELERRLEREQGDDHGDPEVERLRADVRRLVTEVNRLANALDVTTVNRETRQNVVSQPKTVPSVATSDPTPSADLNAKTDALKAAEKPAEEADEKAVKWTVSSYLMAAGSLVAIGLGLWTLLAYLQRKAAEKPTDDLPPLDDATKKTLDDLVAQLHDLSDANYWAKLADYIDAHADTLSLGDQLVFMNITVQLSKMRGTFLWDSAQDQSDMADRLVKVFTDTGSSTKMIRAAAELKYDGEPIPRLVTAQLLALALAWVGVHASGRTPA